MTIYVITQQLSSWTVAKLCEEEARILASDIPTEERALAVAVQKAQFEKPSRIVRISHNGDSRIIANFDTPARC